MLLSCFREKMSDVEFNYPPIFLAEGELWYRALNADSDAICDIIPVDTVINMMCAVAYRTAGQYDRKAGKRPSEIPVYNCNSGRHLLSKA